MIIEKIKKNKFNYFLSVFLITYISYDILLVNELKKTLNFGLMIILIMIDVITKALQKNRNYLNRFYNDYNEEFLPETQNNLLDFRLIKLNFIRNLQLEFLKKEPEGNNLLSFFIELLSDERLLIIDRANIFILEDYEEKKN